MIEEWIDEHSTFVFWISYLVLSIPALSLLASLATGFVGFLIGFGACRIIWSILEDGFGLTPWGDS